MSNKVFTVAEVAESLKLTAKKVSGTVRYIGANPTGQGATKDGFVLFPEGNAMDNNGARYTSPEVAKMAGIDPNFYEPVARYSESSGRASAPGNQSKASAFDWSKATVFDYTDEAGNLLFQVGRIGSGDSKEIRQRRPNGRGGWINSLGDVRRVLYRLPEVLAARSVLIVEGEKATEAARLALSDAGLLGEYAVTTSPGGSKKWKSEFCEHFIGRRIFVLPDNDFAGKSHAGALKNFFQSANSAESPYYVRRVDLPKLPPKGDIADFLASGGSITEVLELCEAAPPWDAEDGQETPLAARHQFFSFADLERLPRPLWLVEGLLVEETTSVLSADSGSFKSFFALDMALCVATGRPFHGRQVKAGAVVYVAAEGFFTLRDRATAWARFHGVELPRNFQILQVPVNVSDAATAATFIQEASAFKPVLVVLDTLSQNALGLNENSNDEMARFMAGMMATAKQLSAHVQAVHHNSKAGNLRGAGAIHNNADAHIALERPEGDTTNMVFVRCEKQRGAPFQSFALRGSEVTLPYVDEHGNAITSLAFELAGDTPAPTGDGRAERKALATNRIMEVLHELRAELGNGETVTKSQWLDAVVARGVCQRTAFYDLSKELERVGRWHWWKGDCRTDTPESNADAVKRNESVKSEKSAK